MFLLDESKGLATAHGRFDGKHYIKRIVTKECPMEWLFLVTVDLPVDPINGVYLKIMSQCLINEDPSVIYPKGKFKVCLSGHEHRRLDHNLPKLDNYVPVKPQSIKWVNHSIIRYVHAYFFLRTIYANFHNKFKFISDNYCNTIWLEVICIL